MENLNEKFVTKDENIIYSEDFHFDRLISVDDMLRYDGNIYKVLQIFKDKYLSDSSRMSCYINMLYLKVEQVNCENEFMYISNEKCFKRLKTFCSNVEQLIKEELFDDYKVWDADICGTDYHYFEFNEKYYELIYSWWIKYDPDWNLLDEWTYKEVDIEDLPYKPLSKADWLIL